MRRAGVVAARSTRCTCHADLNPRLRCRRGCWRRRRAPLTTFHRLIQGLPISDVDQSAATMEGRERRELGRFPLGVEEIPQSGLDQIRRRSPLTRCLTPELARTVSSILSVVFIWESIRRGRLYVHLPAFLRSQPGRCLYANILPVPEINLPVIEQKSACCGSKTPCSRAPSYGAPAAFSSARRSLFRS